MRIRQLRDNLRQKTPTLDAGPPGTSQRTDKPLLLKVLGITAAEYTARFTYPVHTGWRLTCTSLRKVAAV
jgi:hypothetical protein